MSRHDPAIAIVGCGGLFPGAQDLETFWTHVRNGVWAGRDIPAGRWPQPASAYLDPAHGRPDKVASIKSCSLDEITFDPSGLDLKPELLRGLDPLFLLTLKAGRQAFESGKTGKIDRRRIGVTIANIILPTDTCCDITRAIHEAALEQKIIGSASHEVPVNPRNRFAAGLPAGLLARALGLGGGCVTLDAACASSLYALKLACEELKAYRADAMITGGVSRPSSHFTQMGFSQLRALSPSGVCRPFDHRADGLVVGEGAGLFLVKRLDDALRDGDTIYAVVRGIGLANDVGGSLLAPDAEGQLRAMHAAYAQAGWKPSDIDLVECHGTGTPVGDGVEFASLKGLWKNETAKPGQCVIGSVKSNVGHLLTGAGGAGLMKVLFALKNKTLPPTANFERPDPKLKIEETPFKVLQKAEAWAERSPGRPRRAAVSAFGFGGIDAHVLLEEWNPKAADNYQKAAKPPIHEIAPPEPVAIIGMDARFGPLKNLREFQEAVFNGVPARVKRPAKRHPLPESPAKFAEGAYLEDLEVPLGHFRISPMEIQDMLPQQLLMLMSVDAALADCHGAKNDSKRWGVGIGIGQDFNATNFAIRWAMPNDSRQLQKKAGFQPGSPEGKAFLAQVADAATPPLSANRTTGALGGIVASRIAREFQVGGPSHTFSSEETSGLRALEAGIRGLQRNEIDTAIVGAVDLAGDLRHLWAVDRDRPLAEGVPGCPFDEKTKGWMPGEGACSVILKRLADARRDGDRIYCVLSGFGAASGGSPADLCPDGEAIYRASETALREAGVPGIRVGMIEAHGSGFPTEDAHEALGIIRSHDSAGKTDSPTPCALGSVKTIIGHTGSASGLAGLVKASLCLYHEILPPLTGLKKPLQSLAAHVERFFTPSRAQYWIRDREEGPRAATVQALGVDGSAVSVVLKSEEPVSNDTKRPAAVIARERRQPLGVRNEALFIVEGKEHADLVAGLETLESFWQRRGFALDLPIEFVAKAWLLEHPLNPGKKLAVSIVAGSERDLFQRAQTVAKMVREQPAQAINGGPMVGDRAFYNPEPVGKTGKVAFVFPGSGNQYFGTGLETGAQWPHLFSPLDRDSRWLRKQFAPHLLGPWRLAWDDGWEKEANARLLGDHNALVFSHVSACGLFSDALRQFGVEPGMVLGYSLGETAGNFATRTWRDRDGMVERMAKLRLFTHELIGNCESVRQWWGLKEDEKVDWQLGLVDRPAAEVKSAMEGIPRAYILIINTPGECVIGGDRTAVQKVVSRLKCAFFEIEGVSTVHCEVAKPVSETYRNLHFFETTPPEHVTFFSGGLGKSFKPSPVNSADSILAQCIGTINYPKIVEEAWEKGGRVFIELGPRNSCSRMIGRILGSRPHMARTIAMPGQDETSMLLRLLGALAAERVAIDLSALYAGETVTAGELRQRWNEQRKSGTWIKLGIGEALPLKPVSVAQRTAGTPAASSSPQPVSPVLPVTGTGLGAAPSQPQAAAAPRASALAATPAAPIPTPSSSSAPVAAPAPFRPAPPLPQQPVMEFNTPMPNPTYVPPIVPETQPQAGAPAVPISSGVIGEWLQAQQATAAAHDAFLRLSNNIARSQAILLEQQIAALSAMSGEDRQSFWQAPQPAPVPAFQPVQPPPMAAPDYQTQMVQQATTPMQAPPAQPRPVVPAHIPPGPPLPPSQEPVLERALCVEFAIGKIGKVLGPDFDLIDTYPTRVRLPDGPLNFVDRITHLSGTKGNLGHGRCVTEHDVHSDSWYLDAGTMPTGLAVEAGQADLFLSGYLGIDFKTKGLAMYRLLDATVTYHGPLPRPGQTIRYDIKIDRFIRQADTYLFFFQFDGTIDGRPLITMRDGCAGFFTPKQLAEGKGIVLTEEDVAIIPKKRPPEIEALMKRTGMKTEGFEQPALTALRGGDLAGAFGPAFVGLPVQHPLTIPAPPMLHLIDRVTEIQPNGGRFGLGFIKAEIAIPVDPWFLTCHFIDDQVMPGTLMYESCMQAMKVFLLRMGWVAETGRCAFEPVLENRSKLRCRGQVIPGTKKASYEITIKEIGYGPEPYAIGDALMFADGKMMVQVTDMSIRLTGATREDIERIWGLTGAAATPTIEAGGDPVKPAVITGKQIWEYAIGKPSICFGERYKPFDKEKFLARLPNPPYLFVDRITEITVPPCEMKPGGTIEGQFDIDPNAWYFKANRQESIPFAVLLEFPLQVCGFFSAYMGSAFAGDGGPLHYRNLDGKAVLHEDIRRDAGTLTARVTSTKVAQSGGMIIQAFDMSVTRKGRVVYEGNTVFGFFSPAALANQVGVRGGVSYEPTPAEMARQIPFEIAHEAPLTPDDQTPVALGGLVLPGRSLLMNTSVDLFIPDGGPKGLGFIRGRKPVDTSEWFFKAHFYQDPVIPGSLGLEAFLQLLKVVAIHRWGKRLASAGRSVGFQPIAVGIPQVWSYRGQVIPTNGAVTCDAMIEEIDDKEMLIKASGYLKVDGKMIYTMKDFAIRVA